MHITATNLSYMLPRIGRPCTSCHAEWLVFPSIGKQAECTLFYLEPITIADGQTGGYSADDKYHTTLQDAPCLQPVFLNNQAAACIQGDVDYGSHASVSRG
jgi:hypothetical protein